MEDVISYLITGMSFLPMAREGPILITFATWLYPTQIRSYIVLSSVHFVIPVQVTKLRN